MFKRTAHRMILSLGVCLLYGAFTASAGTLPTQVREGAVQAAWFSRGTCSGGTDPVHIRIEPNPARRIQIGFFESSASAIGQQWRTAGWMAALVSTTLLGQDLHHPHRHPIADFAAQAGVDRHSRRHP
jgi:hypothetical protein